MRKIYILAIASLFSVMTTSAFSEMGMGITANYASVDTSGTETLRDSANKTSTSVTEDIVIPEIFVEAIGDAGAFGIAYIPAQALGSKSRSDTNSEGDTGTYKAEAELDQHVMIYADLNLGEVYGSTVYAKGGLSHAKIKTTEALNSGSSYPDKDVLGLTFGLGAKGDFGGSYYYKIEGTYTEYDSYDANSASNKIEADTEVTSVKASIGYKF